MNYNTVYVTENFEHMSDRAADILIPELRRVTVLERKFFNGGFPTGNSPTGLYKRIAEKQDKFNASYMRSWNLDEYVGLPGKYPSERVLHPESYAYFMIKNLFGKLDPPFKETHIPLGTEIDQEQLEHALEERKGYTIVGAYDGKVIDISPCCEHPYLKWIREEILDSYIESIRLADGIDWWVVGTGGNGHIGFHESGIPLECEMFLVKLDDKTRDNALKDGHFSKIEEVPKYAVSIGAGGICKYSRNILLLASGDRKTEPITRSLLGPVTSDVPISCLQDFAKDKTVVYVLDQIAAAEILKDKEQKKLIEKGVIIKDLRK